MIENKDAYIKAISTRYTNPETIEVIYKLLCEERVKPIDLRDLAIIIRFNELNLDKYLSSRDKYDQLSAEFNCSFKLVQNAILKRRVNKFNNNI